MSSNSATLLDRADQQWMSLRDLIPLLATVLDQPSAVVRRLASAYNVESVRPTRVSFDDGTGLILSSTDNTTSNDTIAVVISHQLKSKVERQQASESIRRVSDGAIVEFTVNALYEWLVECQLVDEAETAFGEWMQFEYSELKKHNLLVVASANPNEETANVDLVEIHRAIVELKAANENLTPLDHGVLWKYDDVARYIGRSVQTVRRLAGRRDFPSPIQVNDAEGRVMSPLFEPKSIVAWFAKQKLPRKS